MRTTAFVVALTLSLAGCGGPKNPLTDDLLTRAKAACQPHGGLKYASPEIGPSVSCGWKCVRHGPGVLATCNANATVHLWDNPTIN